MQALPTADSFALSFWAKWRPLSERLKVRARSLAAADYSSRSNSFINGSRRTRTALARNTALARAGAVVGMARKLAPAGGRSPGTVMTSTSRGSCAMLASG